MNRQEAQQARLAWSKKSLRERENILRSLSINDPETLKEAREPLDEIYYNISKDTACDIVQTFLDGEWN